MSRLPTIEGGMVIGGYELVRRLGRGGMAEVWVARKTGRSRQQKYVAVKLMADRLVGKERYARMFRAEADLAAMLTHANVVQVFDEGVEDGRAYLVMEWVDGINLVKLGAVLSLCEEDLRDRVAAYVVGQLLHALAYAHSITTQDGEALGVVHRDVTPHNILISNHGDVKLTDFGVAHFAHDESSGLHVKGKVRYMSPEQLSGHTRGQTLDLYAAGAILHELLDGKRFRADAADERAMYADILAGRTPMLSRRIPPELDAVRLGLLEADPTRRIQTAEEAVERLRLWSGYGEMKLELSRLVASMTGVTRPRTGPGAVSETGRPHSEPQARGPSVTPATVALDPASAMASEERGGTVLLPAGGLPEGVAAAGMSAQERALREAPTATSLVAGQRTVDFAPPKTRWPLLVLVGVLCVGIGSVAAWLIVAPPTSEAAPPVVAGDPVEVEVEGEVEVEVAVAAPAEEDEVKADPEPEPEPEPEPVAAGDADVAEGEPVLADPAEAGDAAPEEDEAPEAEAPGETEPAQAPEAGHDGGRRRAKPRGSSPKPAGDKPTAVVHVRLVGASHPQIKVGAKKITAAFDGRLPVGRHRVQWRSDPEGKWRAASPFRFEPGAEYKITVTSSGPSLRRM